MYDLFCRYRLFETILGLQGEHTNSNTNWNIHFRCPFGWLNVTFYSLDHMIKGEASDKPSKLIAKTEKAKNLFVLGIISLPAFPVEAYNSYGRLNGYF